MLYWVLFDTGWGKAVKHHKGESVQVSIVTSVGLSLGNVYLSIDAEYPIRILPHVEKTHSEFRVGKSNKELIDFSVYVLSDNRKNISESNVLIGETSSWKVYESSSGGRELVWPGADGNGYLWRLVIALDRLSATVYVGESWLEEHDGIKVIKDIVNYPLDELLFMYAASGRNGLLVHSAGCVVNDDIGLVFCGKSGAGKSTISKQLVNDADISLVSDDRIIIHKNADGYFMSGTPWPGEAGIAANRTAPLRALFFLKQSDDNRLEPIPVSDAFKQLLPVSTIPWHEKELLPDVLDYCNSIAESIPTYNLYFARDTGVAELVKEFVHTLL